MRSALTLVVMIVLVAAVADASAEEKEHQPSSGPTAEPDALPTSLLLLEGMIETNPSNRDVAVLASMLYFSYAFAFVESEDPVRASDLYDRGRELGWHALDRPARSNRGG